MDPPIGGFAVTCPSRDDVRGFADFECFRFYYFTLQILGEWGKYTVKGCDPVEEWLGTLVNSKLRE
jgi:hypothetical protein